MIIGFRDVYGFMDSDPGGHLAILRLGCFVDNDLLKTPGNLLKGFLSGI